MQPLAPDPSPVIQLQLEAPGQQRRATVAFRWILAFPHLLWLYLLVVVAYFALLFGWIVALFTGRLPLGIAEFVTKILKYATRVFGYSHLLLTDRYPRFTLDASDYPVEVEVPAPGRLNRVAVLFRFILMVPGAIVTTLVMAGTFPVLVVAWLITLITGRLPRSLFEAFSAVLRYVTRYYGFVAMLTSEQPKKLFGDGPTPDEVALPPTPTALASPALIDGPPPAPPVGPGLAGAEQPRITRLVLSKAGKRLVVLFIVLGALLYGGGSIAVAIASNQLDSAANKFVKLEDRAAANSARYQRETQACALEGGLPCLQDANTRLADDVARSRAELDAIKFPGSALAQAHALDATLVEFESRLRELASSPDAAAYRTRFAALQAYAATVNGYELDLARALNIEIR